MKKILLLLILAAGSVSCAVVDQMQADQRAKKVEIGMTEREVVRIMGQYYAVAGASGNVRIIEYAATPEYSYMFRFVSGKLESFGKERSYQPPVHPHPGNGGRPRR